MKNKKKGFGPSDWSNNTTDKRNNDNNIILWVHNSYPYVPLVKGDRSIKKTTANLNEALKNADIVSLEKEIQKIKKLIEGAIEMDYKWGNVESEISTNLINDDPSAENTLKNLNERLIYLESLLEKLKLPKKVTSNQVRDFLESPKEDYNGWTTGTQSFLVHEFNQLSEEEKKELEAQFENYGKAGIFELHCMTTGKVYIQEDENVFKAIIQIFPLVFPEYIEYYNPEDLDSFFYDIKYEKDSSIKKMWAYAHSYSDWGYNALDYNIYTDTDYRLKEEKYRKETLKQIKSEIDKKEFW